MLKADDHNHHREIEQPVDDRNINLAGFLFGRVHDAHRRQIAKTHRLARQREYAGDHRLRGDHRGQRRENQHRNQRPVRRQQEERVFDGLRMLQQQRALAEIVEHQRRQHHHKPCQANRKLTKVAHIGIQRFNAGDRQHHRAQREERYRFVLNKEVQRPVRVHGVQHLRIIDDTARAQHRQNDEPQQHHRRKQLTDNAGAVFLNHKQQRQYRNRQRHNVAIEARCGDLQPFDGRKLGYRRRDHHFPVEEAAANQPHDHQNRRGACAGIAARQ